MWKAVVDSSTGRILLLSHQDGRDDEEQFGRCRSGRVQASVYHFGAQQEEDGRRRRYNSNATASRDSTAGRVAPTLQTSPFGNSIGAER
jgi:hypothetical protein